MTGLQQLNALFQAALQRKPAGVTEAGGALLEFTQLKGVSEQLRHAFDGVQAVVPPASEKRRQALNRFSQPNIELTPYEWRYVFAGLSDRDAKRSPLLQDDAGFRRVHAKVDSLIAQRQLNRRDWLALCFSYFSCDETDPDQNRNWQTLRSDIDRGFDAVCAKQGREKAWMQVVRDHRDLFGKQPGARLADEMFEGRTKDLSMLESIAQVPGNSWLWRSIFAVVLSRIFTLSEAQFLTRLPQLLKLIEINALHENPVIGACLTRYADTTQRGIPPPVLLDLALDRWGNPQVRTSQNLWQQHVDETVCAMAVAWLAKQDLNHFFTLLKGESGVDQSRLFFWLRYADQMSFTRIVMGSSAANDQSTDFVAFRAKNRNRLSVLTSTTAANNAVVMRLGNYYFVEFSATGNACYVYQVDKAPFDPTARELSLHQLKQKFEASGWWTHSPAPYRPDELTGWLSKFDLELGALGIRAGQGTAARAPIVRPSPIVTERSRPTPSQIPEPAPAVSLILPADAPHDRAEDMHKLLRKHLGAVEFQVFDQRQRGGVLLVQLRKSELQTDRTLRSLGFKPKHTDPLKYWKS